MGSRVCRPETMTIHLSQGDWIVVKKRLNAGEYRAYLDRMHKEAGPNGDLFRVDPLKVGQSRILAYLVDWSFQDDHGVIRIAGKSAEDMAVILDTLNVESFKELTQAVEAHEASMEQEREAAKNDRDGESSASVISPLPSGVAGASSGSVN